VLRFAVLVLRIERQDYHSPLHVEDIQLAVGDERGAADLAAIAERPEHLAGLGVEAEEFSGIVRNVKPAVGQRRRGEPEPLPFDEVPNFLRPLGLGVDLAGVEADDAAHRPAFQVVLAVVAVDEISFHDGRTVDDAVSEGETPDEFTGADLEGIDVAIGAAGDEQALAADNGDDRAGIVRSLDGRGGFAPPHEVAGLAVEGGEAIGGPGAVAPTGIHHADDDHPAIENGRDDAAAVAADAAVFLG